MPVRRQQTLQEAYVVRAALEEAATRLCLLRATVPGEGMARAVEAMERAALRGDRDGVGAASATFHRQVVEASGNQLLRRAWEALQIDARTSIALIALEPDLSDVAREHRELLDVMLRGELEAACGHARDHQLAYARLTVPDDATVTPFPTARS